MANCILLGVGLCSGIVGRYIFVVEYSGQSEGLMEHHSMYYLLWDILDADLCVNMGLG